MATNYPGSLDTSTQQPSPSASTEMDDSGFEHDAVHTNHSGAIIALETKVGTGDSNAVANSVLAGTGSGTSAWTTGALANDISGNAATATALETARTINGTSFNGTANITVTAAAGTLTGSTLNSGVTASSLTSVGTLANLTVSGVIDVNEVQGDNGSASDPSFTFTDDNNTGMYRYSADSIGFACGGGAAVRISSNDDLYVNGDYIAFNSVSSVNDSIRVNGDQFQFRTGGTDRMHITSAGYIEGSGRRYYFGINSNDYIGFDETNNEYDFISDGTQRVRIGESVLLDRSNSSFWSISPPTGTGNDAEWSAAFGYYYLRRNSSTAAEKVNIQTDLEGWLTPEMIDSVVPKMWARTATPDYPEIGPIAEDMDAISPFLGTKGTDADGEVFLNGIDRNAYLSLLVLAVKDLRARVAELESGS